MNPLCPNCETIMARGHNEYYCPKCGLVIDDHRLEPAYDKERGPFVQPWMANLPQTMPAEQWVGNRCTIRGLNK